jgi:hypothetical protein
VEIDPKTADESIRTITNRQTVDVADFIVSVAMDPEEFVLGTRKGQISSRPQFSVN